jgi:hypothetical protein
MPQPSRRGPNNHAPLAVVAPFSSVPDPPLSSSHSSHRPSRQMHPGHCSPPCIRRPAAPIPARGRARGRPRAPPRSKATALLPPSSLPPHHERDSSETHPPTGSLRQPQPARSSIPQMHFPVAAFGRLTAPPLPQYPLCLNISPDIPSLPFVCAWFVVGPRLTEHPHLSRLRICTCIHACIRQSAKGIQAPGGSVAMWGSGVSSMHRGRMGEPSTSSQNLAVAQCPRLRLPQRRRAVRGAAVPTAKLVLRPIALPDDFTQVQFWRRGQGAERGSGVGGKTGGKTNGQNGGEEGRGTPLQGHVPRWSLGLPTDLLSCSRCGKLRAPLGVLCHALGRLACCTERAPCMAFPLNMRPWSQPSQLRGTGV